MYKKGVIRPRLARFAGTALLFAACLTPTYAHADESNAEAMFQEGIAAMKRNDFPIAVEAFAKSNKYDPSPGTQINLALAFEKQKKWASAWTWYRSAMGLARQREQKAREQLADDSANRLKPLIHYLVISVREPLTDLIVKRDGIEIPITLGGKEVPLPTDPGEHTIEVAARGKQTWSKTLTVADTPATEKVDVPALVAAPVEERPAVTASSAPGAEYRPPIIVQNDGNTQRAVGLVVGGAGLLAGLAAGGVFIVANNEADERDVQRMAARNAPNPDARRAANDSADSHSDAADNNQLISILLLGGGVVLVGVGAIVYFTAPRLKEKAENTKILPLLGPSFACLGIGRSF